jgi:hypothetical protein
MVTLVGSVHATLAFKLKLAVALASLPHRGSRNFAAQLTSTTACYFPTAHPLRTCSVHSHLLRRYEAPHPQLSHLRHQNMQNKPRVIPTPPPRFRARDPRSRHQLAVPQEHTAAADVGGNPDNLQRGTTSIPPE